MLHGITEELGELVEATNAEKLLDAAADIMIYVASFCTHKEWVMQEIWARRFELHPLNQVHTSNATGCKRMLICLGRLSHHHLKEEQKIRGDRITHRIRGAEYLSSLLGYVQTFTMWRLQDLGHELVDLVENAMKVWREEVQPRNWADKKESTPVDAG